MPTAAPTPPTAAAQRTLLELAEPLFQYICRLNRAGRRAAGPPAARTAETSFFAKGAKTSALSLDYTVVRAEVKALLDDFQHKAAGDFRLATAARKLELPLMFFVDSMIAESRLPFAPQWNQNRLAYERNELAGDEAFFDALEEAMKDPGEEATERLAVFYVCLGLGFTGINFGQPEYLRRTLLGIAPRIRHLIDSDQMARICPEAYERVDTRNLIPPPSNKLVILAILFVCFCVAALTAYFVMYREASHGLNDALNLILQNDPAQ